MKFKSLLKIIALSGALLAPLAANAQIFDVTQLTEAQSAIQDAGKNASAVRALRNVPSVGVIHLDYRFAPPTSSVGNQIASLQILAEQNGKSIGQLRRALMANPVTRDALVKRHVDVSRIIGVRIGSTGSLRVFIND